MSWRERDKHERWNDKHIDKHDRWSDKRNENAWKEIDSRRGRSPAGERYREGRRDRDRDKYERRERSKDRHERDRCRERERRRSPRRDARDVPEPPSPPKISSVDGDIICESNMDISTRDSPESDAEEPDRPPLADGRTSPGDWFCPCGSYNFKRRLTCYRRNCPGKRCDATVYTSNTPDGSLSSQPGITKKLLFRRLDALTTEEKILDALKEKCSKSVVDSIVGITIGREPLTGASKCLAYINFNSISDSTAALTELNALEKNLNIDGRDVLVSYFIEQTKFINKTMPNTSTEYNNYYAQAYNSSVSKAMSEADRVNAAAAVAQSAISAAQARQLPWTPSQTISTIQIPTGDGITVYTAPDVRTFMYDESSGYYYDPNTGLYYDGTTQYFFNSSSNQYMYWDGTSSTYVKAPQNTEQTDTPPVKEPEEKKKKDKEDKVKVAKKIAKDMERWAKTLNQKKENARNNYVMEQPLDTGVSKGSADIGFSVLGQRPVLPTSQVREISPPPESFVVKKPPNEDEGIIDWEKLACLLCKRKFPSAEVLKKHKTMSELHLKNLAEYRNEDTDPVPMSSYRDRAAERRKQFGEDEPPIKKRFEMPNVAPPPMMFPAPSVVDTIGGKMLQKMGWQEGKGLGKEEQGRTAPIEAEQRPSLAGLGQKRGIYTPTPGETYRDTVKKLMIARYKEVIGQEEGDK